MTTIREVIEAFAVIEEAMAVTEPRAVAIKQVYRYLPPSRDALNTPCIMHQYRVVDESGRGPNSYRRRTYNIRAQFLFEKLPNAETDVWSEVAAAFDEVFITAFDAAVKLNTLADSTHQKLLDNAQAEYMPAVLEWNGISYVGSQYEFEVQIHDTATMAA